MSPAIAKPIISPVNVEERKSLDIRPGDTVRVSQKIQEKGKTRIQMFEGIVLARKHGTEAGATFTVRRMSGGYGVEKIFPLYTPMIDKIEIVRRAKVRRAKLYYIREKAAREIKRGMRRMTEMGIGTEGEMARAEREAAEAEEVRAEAEAAQAAEETQAEEVVSKETPAEETTETTEEEEASQNN
jgi:large subunit ribosomal protein L19